MFRGGIISNQIAPARGQHAHNRDGRGEAEGARQDSSGRHTLFAAAQQAVGQNIEHGRGRAHRQIGRQRHVPIPVMGPPPGCEQGDIAGHSIPPVPKPDRLCLPRPRFCAMYRTGGQRLHHAEELAFHCRRPL